jgi:hypothetical protein
MGQQLRKYVKRTRRKAYLARKKALAKQGIVRKASRKKPVEAAGDKPAKKVAKKSTKTPSVKKAAAPKAEAEVAPVETAAAE